MKKEKSTFTNKLKAYSALAGSLLAFNNTADAQILYTDVNPDFTGNSNGDVYELDLNNDGTTDFAIQFVSGPYYGYSINGVFAVALNSYNGMGISSSCLPIALNTGTAIDGNITFYSYGAMALQYDGLLYSGQFGNWLGVNNQYLPLRITVGTDNYYGWARLDVAADASSFTLKDFALNMGVNQPINAGQMPTVLSLIETTALNYVMNDPATDITATLGVSDADSPTLTGATVEISANYLSSEDSLGFNDQNGITGSFNTTTGILTLSGSASLANYETALRSVTYLNYNTTSPDQSPRTVTFIATDGAAPSFPVTRTITISLSVPPVLSSIETTALDYTVNDPETVITATIDVSDSDSPSLTGATVQISANYEGSEDSLSFNDQNGIAGSFNTITGTLTLSGTATHADYTTALQSITYINTNTIDPNELPRTVTFIAMDGADLSNSLTRIINVINANPVLASIETTALNYTVNDPETAITAALTLADTDSPVLTGATIQISANYQSTQDVLAFTNANGITGAFNATSGTMTLSGSASLADYETALRSVTYINNNTIDPNELPRTITFTANTGGDLSNSMTRIINVINANPVLASIETTALIYDAGDPATVITADLTLADADSPALTGVTIQISANYQATEDVIGFANTGGITGSFNTATGTMTLTGSASVADYETALHSVTYINTNNTNPNTSARTVTFIAKTGEDVSNSSTRIINVTSDVNINENNSLSNLRVYPNPANDMVNIHYNNDAKGDINIRVNDMIGKTVQNISLKKPGELLQTKIDITGLERGIYFIEVNDGKNKTIKKIIKE